MNYRRIVVFAIPVAAVLVWRWFSNAGDKPALSPDPPSTQAGRTYEPNDVVAVSATLPEHLAVPHGLDTPPVNPAPQPATTAASPPLSEVAKRALVEQTLVEAYPEAAVVRFDDALAKQSANPRWTAQVEQIARRMLDTDALKGTQLLYVDCRDTICGIRIAHTDIEAERVFWHSQFTAEGPWTGNLQGGPLPAGDNRFESFIYFANDQGTDLYSKIDIQISEDTELAVSQVLAEHGVASDNG